jgi:molecular chaperone GrpE
LCLLTLPLAPGVEMTEKILLTQMEKHGVTKFNPVDEKFDPNIMMALFEMPVTPRVCVCLIEDEIQSY